MAGSQEGCENFRRAVKSVLGHKMFTQKITRGLGQRRPGWPRTETRTPGICTQIHGCHCIRRPQREETPAKLSTAPAQSPQHRRPPAGFARPLPRKRRGLGLCPGSRRQRHPLGSGRWGRPRSASKVGVDGASQSQGRRAEEPKSRAARRECGHAVAAPARQH